MKRFATLLVVLTVGILLIRADAVAQDRIDVGRFQEFPALDTAIIHPLLFDSATGECWVFIKDGFASFNPPSPFSKEKPAPHRFKLNPKYSTVLDTATGRMFTFELVATKAGNPVENGSVKVTWTELKKLKK
jgi:hypothetical protein